MIRPYREEDFQYLGQWVTDADLLLRFSGPAWTFPLTEEQIRSHQQQYPCKRLYVGCDAREIPFAIGELIWNEEDSPRLGRILIGDPGQRGKGTGTAFVKELILEFIRLHNPKEICLYVLEGNEAAARCYRKLGFQFDQVEPKRILYNGSEMRMFRMTLDLDKNPLR